MEHVPVLNLRQRLTAVLDEATTARELVALLIRRIVEAVIAVLAIYRMRPLTSNPQQCDACHRHGFGFRVKFWVRPQRRSSNYAPSLER